jgi:hypothetical protein
LNFLADLLPAAGFFTTMNSPEARSFFVHRAAQLRFHRQRAFTAPLRALSPTGLFTAILCLQSSGRISARLIQES